MANDTLQIMITMVTALDYEGKLVRDGDGHVVGVKPNPLSRSVFYAEVLDNGDVTFSIRADDKLVAHGIVPDITYDGYEYFASLLRCVDFGLFNHGKDTKL